MVRRDFVTPSTLPETTIERCLSIPASQEWLGLINSALLFLTQEWRYEQIHSESLTPEETASAAYEIYVAYLNGVCAMDCADILACVPAVGAYQPFTSGSLRANPTTGEPEWSPDAGTTWLGDNFDSALLNGALVEAIRFMKGEQDMVKLYQDMYVQAIALLKNLGDGKLRQDAYRSGQTRTQVL